MLSSQETETAALRALAGYLLLSVMLETASDQRLQERALDPCDLSTSSVK